MMLDLFLLQRLFDRRRVALTLPATVTAAHGMVRRCGIVEFEHLILHHCLCRGAGGPLERSGQEEFKQCGGNSVDKEADGCAIGAYKHAIEAGCECDNCGDADDA